MGLHIKPNCRADFDPAEFSVVCGNDRAAWLLGGNSAREVSPPRDFSQHDDRHLVGHLHERDGGLGARFVK